MTEEDLFSWAEDGNYQDALTDRSNDIGVTSEGYADSPYTVNREIWAATQLNSRDSEKNVGGTYLLRPTDGLGVRHDYTDLDEQYWDGKKPFLIAPVPGNEGHKLIFRTYNDFSLEDTASVVPYAALKIENLSLEVRQVVSNPKMNLYARGNKFVIGEGVTTQAATSLGNNISWRMYGGTEHNHDLANDGRPDVVTNVVVASGTWDYVFGGGEGATGTGTQVTIRGDANVKNVYGGGERKGSVGIDEPGVEPNKGSPDNLGINVYVEDGTIDTLYGGCAINGKGWLTGSHALKINEDINVNVSGGHVDRLFAGSDTHDDDGDGSGSQPVEYSVMGECNIYGDATVNLSGANVADVAVGDINRNLPRAATNVRQIQGVSRLNVYADQELEYMELFDTVNIEGANVKLLNEAGFTAFDSDYSGTEGYIGQLGVTDGGRLELTKRAVINVPYAHYNTSGSWDSNYTEPDKAIKATANHDAYYLRHGWVGEANEADRADSVIAIDGQSAGITAASGTAFNDSSDVCGLLIHGSVGGAFGGTHSWNNDVPGYSTLEVLGDPIYSTDEDYYYYIVSDGTASNRVGTTSTAPASINGGAAFKEPEGADYMVCYRYLEGGKIGWYLRERPEVSASNIFVHTGDQGGPANVTAHVDLKGLGYEWSRTAAGCHVGINVRKVSGSESVTDDSGYTISTADMSGIPTDNRFTNLQYDSGGNLQSFDLLLDDSTAGEAAWYEISPLFIYEYEDTYDDDVRVGTTNECARCIYDFVNTNDPEDADYQDSIMTTTPYGQGTRGADMARLIVMVPFECSADELTVSENDGGFSMTDMYTGALTSATLHPQTQVNRDYSSVTTQTANSAFAVEIGSDDLSTGIAKATVSGTASFDCAVSSYKNVTGFMISNVLSSIVGRDPADGIDGNIGEIANQQGSNGLVLTLQLSDLTRDGEAVGVGDPSTVNYGELRIMTKPLDEVIVPPPTGLPRQNESHEMILILVVMAICAVSGYIGFRKKWSIANGK